jgi:ribose transport system substrate-binding protein
MTGPRSSITHIRRQHVVRQRVACGSPLVQQFFPPFIFSLAAVACIAGLGFAGAAKAADSGKVGLGLPLLTSPFWQSYNNYLPSYAKEMGIDILAPVNSNGDPVQQITDMNNLLNLAAKGIYGAIILGSLMVGRLASGEGQN